MLTTARQLLLFSFVCCALYACKSAHSQLVWSDDFNETGSPDSSKWDYDTGVGNPEGWGNNERQYYTRDVSNARVKDGVLIIEVHKDSIANKAYTSARIVSRKKGDWRYGRIEVKAKLPKGRGTWSAIWMLSTNWKYGGWPASGEIDIMEHVGYEQGVVHGTIHTELYNHSKGTQKEGKITVPDVSEEFHVYAIEWSEKKIDFLVDEKVYHTVIRDPKDDFKGWPFDQPFHLIMNVAVGGNWGGLHGIDDTIWPQKMEVDYVKVYQQR
jgi:beta-glucanase (GH16 family)